MKIISLILICVASFSAFHGQPSPAAKDTVADKFTGVWKWSGANGTFTIRLVKVPARYINTKLDTMSRAVIIGWHQYEADGRLVESTLNAAADTLNIATTIRGGVVGNNTLLMVFNDLTHNRTFSATLTLLPGSSKEGVWTSNLKEKLIIGEDRKYPEGQTVPDNIVLKKEENSSR